MASAASRQSHLSSDPVGENFTVPLVLMMALYFGIGFITELNDVLIPHFKDLFHLTNVMALMVQFAFFGAYFVMSVPCGKLIDAFGYKTSIVLALFTMGLGLLLFVPASYVAQYWIFLAALFVVGSGLALLQVAVNPYVGALGRPDTAAARLNLAGGCNSVAGTIAPRLGAALIFTGIGASVGEIGRSLRMPYLTLALISFAMAVAMFAAPLPKLLEEKADGPAVDHASGGAWQFRHLRLGAIGIFTYVGAEVAIGSLMISFLGQPIMGGLDHVRAAKYVSLYWGGAMIGRFVGSVVLRRVRTKHALAFTSSLALVAIVVVMTQHGSVAIAALVSCGLFNSIMWPCIFPLSLKGLGSHTSQGSGLLVMMVVGGAIVPELQGWLADHIGYAHSFFVVWLCYAYILYFALRGHRNVHEEQPTDLELAPVEII